MPKAVIDSTVLVSAFLTPGGVSAQLLHSAKEGVFLVSLSKAILTAIQYTLAYPHICRHYRYTDEDVADFLNRLRVAAQLATDLPQIAVVIRDPNDDMVIAAALQAQASSMVTRDLDLLSLQTYEDITIMTPETCMAILREDR